MAIRDGYAFQDAMRERINADIKHAPNGNSMEVAPPDDPRWLPVLVEEVGEIARAMCDLESPERLRSEVIQVAAMALAWSDALKPLENYLGFTEACGGVDSYPSGLHHLCGGCLCPCHEAQ